MSSSSKNRVHILVFPYPAQGHMLPLLDLTHQLSLRLTDSTITILITPKNLPILTPLLTANPSIQTLLLPFPTDPSIPPGIENVRDLGNHGNIPIMAALSRLQNPIIQWFNSHHNPPVALLSDSFLGWTNQLAHLLRIPRIAYHCYAAFTFAVFTHLWASSDDVKPGAELTLPELPRSPILTWDQVPSLFRRYKDLERSNKSVAEFIRTSMAANESSWASVFNSFDALEGELLEHLSHKMGPQRVFSVGPLNMVGWPEDLGLGGGADKPDVIQWLDECDDGPVLYVCFGSQKLLTKAQMDALAIGLEMSRAHFVWVVKPLSAQQVADGYGSVPDGFEGRVSGRGFVIKGWAPQTAILNHRAVSGFLSHCGWNSIMEAIASSVMILGWAMEADQFVNAKLLVEYKRAAVLMCEGGDTVPDSAELAQKISESMQRDAAERGRAEELSEKALEAVKVGGSSDRDLNGLVQKLAQLQGKNI